MSGTVQVGPPEISEFPKASLGIIYYNEMQKCSTNQPAMVLSAIGQTIPYGIFFDLSVKLGMGLKKLGVQKGDIITILSHNSWKFLCTTIAGWYLGATISLLNHDYTNDEFKHFFSICQPKYLFCTSKIWPRLVPLKEDLGGHTTIIRYDDNEVGDYINFSQLFLTEDDGSFRPVEVDLDENVALIVTSSGTTGLPKYVELSYGSFRLSMIHFTGSECMDISKTDTTISYLPFCHLMGFGVGLASLLRGSRIVILETFVRENFFELIEKYKVTKLYTVPSVLLYLVKNSTDRQYNTSSIQTLICMAAPLSTELKQLAAKQLNMVIRQGHGTTESGMIVMTGEHTEDESCVGKLLATNQVKVCHIETDKILPANQVGELRVRSGTMMKGYLGSSVKHDEIFDEEGFFKTGDLGYYDDEGFLYIVDRLKDVIKYKGFQVAPTELEGLLSCHPSVKDVGVVGVPDEVAGEVPLAFVVKQPDRNVTELELVRYLEENISFQKRLHGGVKFVDEIPKNSGGKILRKELKEMYLGLKSKL